MPQAQQNVDPVALDKAIQQVLIKNAIDMWQPIYQNTLTGGMGQVVNVPLKNVGLVKKLWLEFSAPITPSAQNQTLQPLGVAAFFSNITFTDLSNQTRINTPSWHLNMVATAKRRRIFGAAYTTDTPNGFGNNYTQIMAAPSSLTGGAGASTVYGFIEIPLAYTDFDLRGAIYAGIVNATLNLQFTVNPNLLVVSTADATQSMYKSAGAAAATLGNVTVTLYQNYLDQLPIDQQSGQPILPRLALGTAYLLNNTSFGGLVANQENPLPYANFREFQSTTVLYDNNGALNAATDIDHFALQSANFTNIFRLDPWAATLMARQIFGDDPPKGVYYFDHRHKPISTIQYGNMALQIQPSNVAAASSSFVVGYEATAIINMVTGAGSIAGT